MVGVPGGHAGQSRIKLSVLLQTWMCARAGGTEETHWFAPGNLNGLEGN